jgi:hypothetical protein
MAEHTLTIDQAKQKKYDAVVVPGGGIDPKTGAPRPWVAARLDAAFHLDAVTRFFMVLSRGTTHRPPPLNARGHPIDEATSSAAYLIRKGVQDPSRILVETWSLDTIGNAYFARMMLAEPLDLRKVLVITSTFHMPRTRTIFEWVFSLPSYSGSEVKCQDPSQFNIDYCVTDDVGLGPDDLASRVDKEREGLKTLLSVTIPRIRTVSALASFLACEHGAYNAKQAVENVVASGATSEDARHLTPPPDASNAHNTY